MEGAGGVLGGVAGVGIGVVLVPGREGVSGISVGIGFSRIAKLLF